MRQCLCVCMCLWMTWLMRQLNNIYVVLISLRIWNLIVCDACVWWLAATAMLFGFSTVCEQCVFHVGTDMTMANCAVSRNSIPVDRGRLAEDFIPGWTVQRFIWYIFRCEFQEMIDFIYYETMSWHVGKTSPSRHLSPFSSGLLIPDFSAFRIKLVFCKFNSLFW